MTRVRLPTTPVPPPTDKTVRLDGVVDGLCGLLVARNDEAGIAARVESLQRRCSGVVVVDDGSTDGTGAAAEAAGARVFKLPAPTGEGAGLRAGMRLAREFGWIGALCPGREVLSAESMDRLAVAHIQAPEAILLGVGPGEAIAGKEWEEAAAIARGEEPVPYPDYRPPRASGLHGRVEDLFELVVETRYAYPWGGPRVLPLQPLLRRDLKQSGGGIHMELLAQAVKAGTPTVEVELERAPERHVPTCRRAALGLLRRFVPLVALSKVRERLGMGSGYAPPTMSPLLVLLSVGLAFAVGCAKPVAMADPTAPPDCPPTAGWPGAGDAEAARDALVSEREAVRTLFVEQGVVLRETEGAAPQRLRGLLAIDGPERFRVRLVGPLATPVLDYVEADGRWALTVPSAGISERGDGRPSAGGSDWDDALPVSPEGVALLVRTLPSDAQVRWKAGACAVLEQLEGDLPVRALRFESTDLGWAVVEDEVLGRPRFAVTYADYRPITEGGAPVWPHRSEIRSAAGSVVELETTGVRTEGFDHVFTLPAG